MKKRSDSYAGVWDALADTTEQAANPQRPYMGPAELRVQQFEHRHRFRHGLLLQLLQRRRREIPQ
jgi:hypothetical protein